MGRRFVFIAVLASLLLAGCTGQNPSSQGSLQQESTIQASGAELASLGNNLADLNSAMAGVELDENDFLALDNNTFQ